MTCPFCESDQIIILPIGTDRRLSRCLYCTESWVSKAANQEVLA